MKYKVGDKFIDSDGGDVIEIVEVTEDGYEVKIDGFYLDYGINELYLDAKCMKIN